MIRGPKSAQALLMASLLSLSMSVPNAHANQPLKHAVVYPAICRKPGPGTAKAEIVNVGGHAGVKLTNGNGNAFDTTSGAVITGPQLPQGIVSFTLKVDKNTANDFEVVGYYQNGNVLLLPPTTAASGNFSVDTSNQSSGLGNLLAVGLLYSACGECGPAHGSITLTNISLQSFPLAISTEPLQPCSPFLVPIF
jgi:hypothetical protein